MASSVAVGETLRRLVTKHCVRNATTSIPAYLRPMQPEVGVANGAECLIHAFNPLIRDRDLNPDTVLDLVDTRNAFNIREPDNDIERGNNHSARTYGWVHTLTVLVRSFVLHLTSSVRSSTR